jgi:hypothetical protein
MRAPLRMLAALTSTAALAACGGGGGGGSTPPSAVGVWDGTYSLTSSSGGGSIQAALLADGTISVRVDSGSGWDLASGSYMVSSGAVSSSFVPDSSTTAYLLSATFDATSMTGSLGLSPASSGLATFSLTRAGSSGEGIYLGQWGQGSDPLSYDFLLIVFPGGDIEVHSGATLADSRALGTWSLSGADFSADYTYDGSSDPFDLAGTRSGGTLAGTWTDSGNAANDGTFSVTREN